MTKESIMSFGPYKGKSLQYVPASYLLYLYEKDKCSKDLKKYIDDNIETLKSNSGKVSFPC